MVKQNMVHLLLIYLLGESEIPDLKQKVRHHSTKSSTNDEANFEEELDYDEDFSDDDEGKKRGRFRNERTESDIKKKPTGDRLDLKKRMIVMYY